MINLRMLAAEICAVGIILFGGAIYQGWITVNYTENWMISGIMVSFGLIVFTLAGMIQLEGEIKTLKEQINQNTNNHY